MSAFHVIKAIEKEAAKRAPTGDDAYQLEIVLRSGRKIICAPWKADTYMLKITETVLENDAIAVERISYLAYEAIDQVTPIWL